MLRTTVVLDYQNVHLTARDIFDHGGHPWQSLIHPVHFARRALIARNEKQREGMAHAELSRVLVYRGLPHPDHDWEQSRRCVDQATAWRAAGAYVELRDLKYSFERGADGRPILDVHGKKKPVGRPREKGIDVLCALACVREAGRVDVELVILASCDTDLVPVLDEVHELHAAGPDRFAKIETASWFDADARRQKRFPGKSLRATSPRRIWNTNLDRACYEASLDRTNYR